MKHIRHTVFVTQPGTSLTLADENLCFQLPDATTGRIPLVITEQILVFTSRCTCSLALMHYCAEHEIALHFLTGQGKYRFSVIGATRGNALLRKAQYLASDGAAAATVTRTMLSGKIRNARYLLRKCAADRGDSAVLQAAERLQKYRAEIETADSIDRMRGIEGAAAAEYYRVFDRLIRTKYTELHFFGRNRRPPEDPCNAMLSLAYTLLVTDCRNALETVGLDPQLGMTHTYRPGKPSLALDLSEELRSVVADRFVLRLINLQMVTPAMFEERDGTCNMTTEGRQLFFREWNEMKKRTVRPEGMDETVEYGFIPYLQAQNLARFLRGDDTEYRPVIWR